jgi:hypothetical protein
VELRKFFQAMCSTDIDFASLMTFYVHIKDTMFWIPTLYTPDRCVLGAYRAPVSNSFSFSISRRQGKSDLGAGGEAWIARFEGALPVELDGHD